MKLRREDIRISLQGKNKEVLTNIYNLLVSLKQTMYSSLERDLINLRDWEYYEFYNGKWCLSNNDDKKEVTIEELKEILQPKDLTLEQQLQKAEAEVKRLQSLIEEENKIKVGDWFLEKCTNNIRKHICPEGSLYVNSKECEKITDQDLINKLNGLIK